MRLSTYVGGALSALLAIARISAAGPPDSQAAAASPATLREVRRFAAPEARQGVAVDARYFYAVGNREIGKYDKQTGRREKVWQDAEGGRFIHLNACVAVADRLYCAHSNYPAVPMESSIEIFDSGTLEPVATHGFAAGEGSATWVDRHDGRWWVGFAHYDGKGGEPGKGAEHTALVVFDDQWRRLAAYSFPPELVRRFRPYSNSGGARGDDGLLYVTGHDAAEVYAMRLPKKGTVLELSHVLAAPIAGQGIAWDHHERGALYGIVKANREVVVSRFAGGATP